MTILARSSSLARSPTLRREPTVRGPPALARHKSRVALGPIGSNKPLHLPNANPKPFRRRALADNLVHTCAITTSLSRSRPLIANAPAAINAPAQSTGDIPKLSITAPEPALDPKGEQADNGPNATALRGGTRMRNLFSLSLRRLAPTSLAAALVLCVPGPANAGVTVFTNFIDSLSFNKDDASLVGTLGFANLVDAMPFTAAATADLEDAVLALSFDFGMNNPITLDLESNESGLPGAILATLLQTGNIPTKPGLVTFNYAGAPVELSDGAQYWLVALQPDMNSLDDWFYSNGDTGGVAFNPSGDVAGPWAVAPDQPISAFRVDGAAPAAPEPATAWLMGLGLAAVWVGRRVIRSHPAAAQSMRP